MKSIDSNSWKYLPSESTHSIVGLKLQDPEINTNEKEVLIQQNAAIIGQKAETYFIKWACENLMEWGEPQNLTDKVGHGYDVYFPKVGYCIEVKGCRGNIEPIRLTRHEWYTAEIKADAFYLVIISQLNQVDFDSPEVKIIKNPYKRLHNKTKERSVTQIYYEISPSSLE